MYTFSAFDQFGGSATADTIWVTHRREEYSFNLGQHSMAIRGGTLSCRNIGITNTTDILQSGGSVIVSNQFSFLAIPYPAPFPIGGYIIPAFVFSGGTLSASNIEMHTTWRILGSSNTLRISNPGSLQLAGTLELNSADFPAEEHLGRFILANNSFISLPGLNSILKFAASSAENWNPGAFLIITNWTGSQAGGGSERLMFGANQSGLSASQLSQIQFHISTNRYPARILSTGEVVPLIPQSLEFSNTGGSLVLTWPANVWMLQTSTNVSGPYFDISNASPPYTTGLTTNRQQFFRLRLN
jgi:hypothetical protein